MHVQSPNIELENAKEKNPEIVTHYEPTYQRLDITLLSKTISAYCIIDTYR